MTTMNIERKVTVAAVAAITTIMVMTWSAPAYSSAPQAPVSFIRSLYTQLNKLSSSTRSKSVLHSKLAAELTRHMDYQELAARVLGKRTWTGLSTNKRTEFSGLLTQMVERAYVRRFRPGVPIEISYDNKPKLKRDGRAQVRTQVTVNKTRASVYYSMKPKATGWRIYDIIVDDVSQLSTYRRTFRKVLKREGWSSLIARMKKSASDK
ncbi:MAG TPA: hypothetical protein DCQ06_10920 [Myxococcales bacterium]|nr:hypothetical protein [Myxococcales bacterium]HAN32099.1 hypothetical protein [Myxococcales bacterium]